MKKNLLSLILIFIKISSFALEIVPKSLLNTQTIMTQEKKLWLNQTINVIEKLVSDNAVSESFVHFAPSEFKSLSGEEQDKALKEIFDNSCSYVQLCYVLRQFTATLRNMIKYSEMSACNG